MSSFTLLCFIGLSRCRHYRGNKRNRYCRPCGILLLPLQCKTRRPALITLSVELYCGPMGLERTVRRWSDNVTAATMQKRALSITEKIADFAPSTQRIVHLHSTTPLCTAELTMGHILWPVTHLTHQWTDPRDPWSMTHEVWLLPIVCTSVAPTADT